jgi:hypothetical protein
MASEYKHIAALVAEQSIEDKRRLRNYLDDLIESEDDTSDKYEDGDEA